MVDKEKKVIDSKTRLDFIKTINSTVGEQIRLADTKATWVFSVLGLLTAVLTNILSKLKMMELLQPRIMIFWVIAVISLVLAFKHIIIVIYPRLSKGNKEGKIYFRDILESSGEEYINSLNNTNEEEMIVMLQSQAYNLAQIANKKFTSLKIAIISSVFALGWIAITAIMISQ